MQMVLQVEESREMKGVTAHRSGRSHCANCLLEIAIRLVLFIIFIQLEGFSAFKRKIHPEELWQYKNPPTKDYVPASVLMPASFVVPFAIICLNFLITHDRKDFVQANNVITLSLGLNGVLTTLLKVTVGRPRPDFFYRCFPNGITSPDMECTGDHRLVNEGRKSFPSGHSSFAFAGFGFIFLYLAGKLHVFTGKGRGRSWPLCVSIFPLVVATVVAISRTCDYHHHWQDVVVGSLLGMSVTCICYRQYYPSILSTYSDRPYSAKSNSGGNCFISGSEHQPSSEQKPLIEEGKESKWI